MNESILISVVDAAIQLQIGKTKMYELISADEVTAIRIGSRRLILRDSLVNFVKRTAVVSLD